MKHTLRSAPTHSRTGRAMLALAALLLVGACGDATSPTVEARSARVRWEHERPADYSFTLTRGCECLTPLVSPVVVEVRGGVVRSLTYAGSGTAVDTRLASFFPTIDGLFAEIEDAAKRADHVDAEYDRGYGYPRHVSIDYDARMVDDEMSITVSGFHSLQ
jgi:hypothetical protein